MKSGTEGPDRWRTVFVVDNEYRKLGKGQATNSIRSAPEERPRHRAHAQVGDSWELADVETVEMQYL